MKVWSFVLLNMTSPPVARTAWSKMANCELTEIVWSPLLALRSFRQSSLALHAAEAGVRHAGIRAAPMACARSIPRAVTIVAQERAAALHALRHEGTLRIDRSFRPGWVD